MAQMEAQKAEMVKIALEKLKEANIKKVLRSNFIHILCIFMTEVGFVKAHCESLHWWRMCQNGHHRRDNESLRHHACSTQQKPLSADDKLRSGRIFAQIQHE